MGRGSRGEQAVSLGWRMSGPRGRQISVDEQLDQSDRTVAASEALEADPGNDQAFDQALDTLFAWRRPVAPPDKPEAPSAVYDRQATEYWRGEIKRLRNAVWAAASERVVPTLEPAIDKAAAQFNLDGNDIKARVADKLPRMEPELGSWSEQANLDKDQVMSSAQFRAADLAAYRLTDNIDESHFSQFADYPKWVESGKRTLLPDHSVSDQLRGPAVHNQLRDWVLSGADEPVDKVIDRGISQDWDSE